MPHIPSLGATLAGCIFLLTGCQSSPTIAASAVSQYICSNGLTARAGLSPDKSSLRLTLNGSSRTLRWDERTQRYSNGKTAVSLETDKLRLEQPGLRVNCMLQIAATSTSQTPEAAMPTDKVLTGNISYRQRIALSPQAEVSIRLEDVSRADAAAILIAESRIRPAGQVPIAFSLPYDSARIEASHRYSLRVRIEENGKLLFINTESYPLPENGSGPMEIRVDALAQ